MNKEKFIVIIEKFIALSSIRLSDDVMQKLEEMRGNEDSALQKEIYDSYFKNLELAYKLKRPCCQDTGILQFYIKAGTSFPYLDFTNDALTEAVKRATSSVPLRPNAVDYFDEINTGNNTGERCPWINWEIVPGRKDIEISVYFSGAGCSLPGIARVFKPSDGLEAICALARELVCGKGANACPPLLVGIGLGHSMDNAALLSKKALLRPLGVSHPHPQGARLESTLLKSLNSLGMGAQGLRGKQAVMGVHLESSARHTATIACGVNVSCYMLRRATIRLKDDLSYELLSYRNESL